MNSTLNHQFFLHIPAVFYKDLRWSNLDMTLDPFKTHIEKWLWIFIFINFLFVYCVTLTAWGQSGPLPNSGSIIIQANTTRYGGHILKENIKY